MRRTQHQRFGSDGLRSGISQGDKSRQR